MKPRARDDFYLAGVKRKIREALVKCPEGLSIQALMAEIGVTNQNSFSVQLSHTRKRLQPFGLTITKAHHDVLKMVQIDG